VSGDEADSGEKTQPPSEYKLREARKKGEVARSTDIAASASYLGLALSAVLFGPDAIDRLGATLSSMLARADDLSALLLGPGGTTVALSLLAEALFPILPFFLLPLVLVILAYVGQRAIILVPSKVVFKLSRISPLQGLRNKFGPSGLFEFLKSLVKLLVFSTIAAIFLRARLGRFVGSISGEPSLIALLIGTSVRGLLWWITAISAAIAVADYLWQYRALRRKLMMTRKEIEDETKQNEGDPALKHKRRQRGYDIATRRMLQDVPEADVLIVNPRHFAVALKWDRKPDTAPVCVAKGVDEIAARMREIAREAGVPIHRDPPAARSIHATVELGEEIRPEQYGPVAAAIRYAERMRKLARERQWQGRK